MLSAIEGGPFRYTSHSRQISIGFSGSGLTFGRRRSCVTAHVCALRQHSRLEIQGSTTMGYVMRGTWVDQWYDTASSGGRFLRQDSRFRSWIGEDGGFSPEAGRYHLYVSWACPWAHRTLIYRALKGLEDAISVTVVEPLMLSNGWVIAADADPVNHAKFLWQVYGKADPDYIGRATVPVLWDRRRETIVNNESSEIIRMFDAWPGARGPLLRAECRIGYRAHPFLQRNTLVALGPLPDPAHRPACRGSGPLRARGKPRERQRA